MSLLDQPYFATLRARLDQLGERQKLIAENIANASTPGYRPRDVDTKAFDRAMAQQARAAEPGGVAIARTQAGHMPAVKVTTAGPRVVTKDGSETTLDGNAVVLEDEIMKAAQTRQQFETSIALYQKGLALLRLAARSPGR